MAKNLSILSGGVFRQRLYSAGNSIHSIVVKEDRDHEKSYPLDEFIAKLRRLADCLEQGKPFEIQIAGERVYVPERATYTIEHEREDGEEEIEFQIQWKQESD